MSPSQRVPASFPLGPVPPTTPGGARACRDPTGKLSIVPSAPAAGSPKTYGALAALRGRAGAGAALRGVNLRGRLKAVLKAYSPGAYPGGAVVAVAIFPLSGGYAL